MYNEDCSIIQKVCQGAIRKLSEVSQVYLKLSTTKHFREKNSDCRQPQNKQVDNVTPNSPPYHQEASQEKLPVAARTDPPPPRRTDYQAEEGQILAENEFTGKVSPGARRIPIAAIRGPRRWPNFALETKLTHAAG